MHRILAGLAAFLGFTGTLLVLPVYAAPAPTPKPVAPSIDTLTIGSVAAPAGGAVVTSDGEPVSPLPTQSAPVPNVPTTSPAPSASSAPSASTSASASQPASSGDELPGVPALTVSKPHTDKFTTVGVTWAIDPGVRDVTAQVRVRNSAGTWGHWSDLELDDTATAAPGHAGKLRGGTAPYWVGDSYGVQVIVQAAGGATPRDVRVQLVDPGKSRADAVPGTPAVTSKANGAMRMPAIYSRAQWGADESIRTWDPEYAPTLKAATIHHTADSNNYSATDVPAILRAMYAYHTISRGWGDIGYNVIVDKFGRAWEGRYGGLASTVIGAHAGGFNTSTFGVSMIGNYDLVDTPQVMLDEVASVIAWKFSLYKINPKGVTVLTSAGGGTDKYAPGVQVVLPTIFGHRDVGNTACPGRYGYSHMDYIRGRVAALMGNMALYQPVQAFTSNADGSVTNVYRGNPGDQPIACDWNGDGVASLGVYRNGMFFLFDSDAQNAPLTAQFYFGQPGDTAVCGDWNGDGVDTIGVWRAGTFFLRNSNTTGFGEVTVRFGNFDDVPVVGDWDGDGRDTVGVRRGTTFYWTNSMTTAPAAAGSADLGQPGDLPVIGDWDGDGKDNLGVEKDGWFLLAGRTAGRAYDVVRFGDPFDVPIAGDWGHDGKDRIGVARDY